MFVTHKLKSSNAQQKEQPKTLIEVVRSLSNLENSMPRVEIFRIKFKDIDFNKISDF